jgi:hypothetical protein
MPRTSLVRWCGLAGIAGGLAIAAFVLLHPWDRFVGAEVGSSPAWQRAHTLHFVGAALSLFGLLGYFAHQREHLGNLGLVGFVVAFLGMSMFVGTGMITAFIWPMVARQAPQAVELGGAMFSTPALHSMSLTAALMITGYVLFGLATWRAGLLPRWGTVALTVGAVLGMIPPQPLGPLPWAGLVVGGVLFGLGSTSLGYAVWRGSAAAPEESK